MLTIRFTRKGRKNQPFFKVVVVDKRRSSKGGRPVEEVGYVDPLTKRKSLNKERILHWIKVGAQPSPTVHNLLVSEKILDAKKINVSKNPKKKAGDAAAATSTPAAPAVPATPAAPAAEAKPEVPAVPEAPATPAEKPANETK